jgi:hypothetical protein
LICSQSTAETGGGVAIVRACWEGAYHKGACCKEGGIGNRVGIGAGSGKDVFRSFGVPLLLHRALSVVYSGGVDKWGSPRWSRMRCSRCIALIVFRCWAISGVF